MWNRDRCEGVPKPISGIELTLRESIRVLGETHRWTRDLTHGCGLQAVGPLYLLERVIEHPTPEASAFRNDARVAEEQIRQLLYRASQS